jgi:hypothetical protein
MCLLKAQEHIKKFQKFFGHLHQVLAIGKVISAIAFFLIIKRCLLKAKEHIKKF